jgi:hypothetical protein
VPYLVDLAAMGEFGEVMSATYHLTKGALRKQANVVNLFLSRERGAQVYSLEAVS